MTLAEILLGKLANWQSPEEGRCTLTAGEEGTGWSAAVTTDRREALSCLVWEMAVRCSQDQGATALQAWAERIARRVTGLLEPLKVVEVDVTRNEAILRSTEPHCRAGDVFYYEVFLHGTCAATLRRYHAQTQRRTRRLQVPFPLTHEALSKLACDLTA